MFATGDIGVTPPLGVFDPLGLADDKSEEELMLFREAELAHGRVAMMGALGFLVPFLVLVSCIFYNEVTTPWTALDALFFGPR